MGQVKAPHVAWGGCRMDDSMLWEMGGGEWSQVGPCVSA